jgi:pyruvate/2-oxoglutarate dehydrogenase complex dihydrolipoamide acyltransferase (E2) component
MAVLHIRCGGSASPLHGLGGDPKMGEKQAYRIERISRMRRFAIDAGYLGRRRHMVHGLIEVDVTDAREIIREYERRTGEKLSITAFIICCLSKAIEEHPHVHAYRDWRNRLVIYKDINITSMFEVEFGPKKIPMPHIFRATNRKSFLQIHDELRAVQNKPHASAESKFMRWFLLLPAFLRRGFYWVVMRFPQRFRDNSSPVMVTAVGMFGGGGGWAITMPNFTLNITVGGISKKPGVYKDEIAIRDYLDITVSIDHDVVDGAPAARFVQSFRALLEAAYGLRDLEGSTIG